MLFNMILKKLKKYILLNKTWLEQKRNKNLQKCQNNLKLQNFFHINSSLNYKL